MLALESAFSGEEGMTFEDVLNIFSAAKTDATKALQENGTKLANSIIEYMLEEESESNLGDNVGWLSGMIVFEVVLAILTAGVANAASMGAKVLKVILKTINWMGDAMGAVFELVGRLGGYVIKLVKKLGSFLGKEKGPISIVFEALQRIGQEIIAFARRVSGKFGKKKPLLKPKEMRPKGPPKGIRGPEAQKMRQRIIEGTESSFKYENLTEKEQIERMLTYGPKGRDLYSRVQRAKTGAEQAEILGYPKLEKKSGYHWTKGKYDPICKNNPGNKGPKMDFDPKEGIFRRKEDIEWDRMKTEGIKGKRPHWKHSENYLQKHLGEDWEPQVSLSAGKIHGSTKPDFYYNGSQKIAAEVKNWNLRTRLNALIKNLQKQAGGRITNLPPGTKQWLFLDIRGQQLDDIRDIVMLINKETGNIFERISIITEKGVERII